MRGWKTSDVEDVKIHKWAAEAIGSPDAMSVESWGIFLHSALQELFLWKEFEVMSGGKNQDREVLSTEKGQWMESP